MLKIIFKPMILGKLKYIETTTQQEKQIEIKRKFWKGRTPSQKDLYLYLRLNGHTHINLNSIKYEKFKSS